MPRKPMITRTMTVTEYNVLMCDVLEGDTYTEKITLPRAAKNDAAALKLIKKLYDTPEIKAAHIISSETSSKQYGMTELDFINTATILSPVTVDNSPELSTETTTQSTTQKPTNTFISKKKRRNRK